MSYSAKQLIANAEALALPLIEPSALRSGLTLLDRAAAEPALARRLTPHGLSAAAPEYLRSAWPSSTVEILPRLRDLSKQLLYQDGPALRLHTDPSQPGIELLCWRYISLALPAGILFAAATPGTRPPLRLDLLHPNLAPTGPVAHLHLHMGAASSLEALWTNLMTRRLPSPREFKRVNKLPQGIDRDEWLALLTRAALARPLLHAVARQTVPDLELAISSHHRCDCTEIRRATHELIRGRIANLTPRREAHLRKLAASTYRAPTSIEEIWAQDPVADGGPWPEGRLLALLFERLTSLPDNLATRLFMQYLRVKSLLHRILVHDPAECGLGAFVHTFSQISTYRKGLESTVLPSFALNEPALDLRAVEVRSSPPASGQVARRMIKDLIQQGKATTTEVAWVFHFIRDVDSRSEQQRASRPSLGDAYCHRYRHLRRSARRLERIIRARPREVLPIVRGLDLAGDERAGPLWLVLPHLKRLRKLSRKLAASYGLVPLRLTLHVGEDFHHLASGLRAVHEPFAWQLIERGDRLGHALALGIDPEKWCVENPIVCMSRWERMLDLAWMIAALTNRLLGIKITEDTHSLVLMRMSTELARHLAETGLRPTTTDAFIKLFTDVLANHRSLPRLIDQHEHPAVDDLMRPLYLRLRGPANTQAKLDDVVTIQTESEKPLLVALNTELAKLIGAWQITIEANPSSNLLIGGLGSPLEQPLFRLHPLDTDGKALPITLNADDPLSFATSLADEYAYTWAALTLAGGVPPGYARQWLDETARASWRSRFTEPPATQSATCDVL